jgi:hypothetical protein
LFEHLETTQNPVRGKVSFELLEPFFHIHFWEGQLLYHVTFELVFSLVEEMAKKTSYVSVLKWLKVRSFSSTSSGRNVVKAVEHLCDCTRALWRDFQNECRSWAIQKGNPERKLGSRKHDRHCENALQKQVIV